MNKEIIMDERKLDNIIEALLLDVGVPDNLLGHKYIAFAVKMCCKYREAIENITKYLYPAVAEQFDTTPLSVERAIRHAVEVACLNMDFATLRRYFGNTIAASKGKPTNGHFLYRLANLAKRRLEE